MSPNPFLHGTTQKLVSSSTSQATSYCRHTYQLSLKWALSCSAIWGVDKTLMPRIRAKVVLQDICWGVRTFQVQIAQRSRQIVDTLTHLLSGTECSSIRGIKVAVKSVRWEDRETNLHFSKDRTCGRISKIVSWHQTHQAYRTWLVKVCYSQVMQQTRKIKIWEAPHSWKTQSLIYAARRILKETSQI